MGFVLNAKAKQFQFKMAGTTNVYKLNLIWMNSIIIWSKAKEYKISKIRAEREKAGAGKISTIKWSNFRFFKSHVLCFWNFFFFIRWMFKMCLLFCLHTIHIFCVLWTLNIKMCCVDSIHRWNIHFMQLQAPIIHWLPVTGTMLHVVNKIQRVIECQFAWIAISFVFVSTIVCLSVCVRERVLSPEDSFFMYTKCTRWHKNFLIDTKQKFSKQKTRIY